VSSLFIGSELFSKQDFDALGRNRKPFFSEVDPDLVKKIPDPPKLLKGIFQN
jgi:hypothetical protein